MIDWHCSNWLNVFLVQMLELKDQCMTFSVVFSVFSILFVSLFAITLLISSNKWQVVLQKCKKCFSCVFWPQNASCWIILQYVVLGFQLIFKFYLGSNLSGICFHQLSWFLIQVRKLSTVSAFFVKSQGMVLLDISTAESSWGFGADNNFFLIFFGRTSEKFIKTF